MRYKIKQWFAGLLSIVMFLSLLPVTAMADEPMPIADSGSINGFEWSLDDHGILILTGDGEMNITSGFGPEISVPWDKDSVQTVIIQGNVTAIGDYTFSEHRFLRHISLPASLTSIGERAFDRCDQLRLTELPAGVTTIKESAFAGCYSLALTELPAGLTAIEDDAFSSCDSLALTELPAGLKTIGDYAFEWCKSLALTEIPEGVTTIGDFAFLVCDGLTHLTLPASLTSMGYYVFQSCGNLTSLTFLGKTAPTIDLKTFWNADSLQEILIPAGATGYDTEGWPQEKVKTGYNVRVGAADNGSASVSAEFASEGTQINLTAVPDPGYHFVRWETDPEVEVTDNSFLMPGEDITVTPVFEPHAFGNSWEISSEKHWHECACGAKQDENEHDYKNGVCSTCGYSFEGSIFYKSPSGKNIELKHVKSTDTVRSVKETIKANEGIPVSMQVLKLSTSGAELEDDQCLADCSVRKDSTLHLILRYAPGGSGTAEDPYLIPDKEQLEAFRYYINDMYGASNGGEGKYFKMTANIDLENESWTPIGNKRSNKFGGTFDGGGHTINGLFIDIRDTDLGLFGYIGEGGTVKNLTVDGTVTGISAIAGIAGTNSGTVENCHNLCNIDATDTCGGVVGSNENGTVTGCYNTGDISGLQSIGGITGSNENGTVTGCYNTGKVTGDFVSIGGIAGTNYLGTVTNCYNVGKVTGDSGIGGIVGISYNGTVKNCYNTGEVTATDGSAGAIAGENTSSTVTNCYYLDTAPSGVGGGDSAGATAKTEAEFASGEVAYLLQIGQPSQIWGQTVGSGYPELTDSTEKTVYKVTFMTNSGEYAVKYANRDGVKELPLGPVVEGMVFDHWSADNFPNGEPFTASTTLTRDITVYAQGQSRFAGDVEDIEITETYGYTEQLTVNLDTHMHFEKEADVDSLFTYQLTNNGGVAGALIEVSTLTIPTGLNAGTYTLTVTASKAPPEFTLMSVGTYGTDPVTLTVKITISKADSKVETPPAGKTGLTYTGTEQELVTAGAAIGGTMQYSLDGTTYSRSIPKGVEAGEYTVWYKAVGDENHNNSEPQSISVTIGKATPTVTVQAVTGTYGDDITVTAKVTVGDLAANLISGKIEFKDGDTTLGTADVVNGTATLTVLGSEREKQHALFGTDGSSTVSAAYTGNDNISNGDGNSAATVSQRTLEYDVTATGREYEPGKTEVDVSLIPKNLIKGDEVTLTATGNLSAADAYTYESVSLTEITVEGTDKAYYTVANTADDVTLTSPVTISKADSKVETPPIAAEGLTYTGNPLILLAGEAISNGGTMQYYVGKKDSTEQPDETADWKDNISDITAADAGTYTIWYRANGNNDYATSDLGSITVVIAKGESSVTKTPTPINRAYDGADHPLVEAGAAEGGTMQYSLEQNGKYSETIPNGQEAGEYTVWYKVVGDKNHNDSEPRSISVTIEKANGTGTLTMADFTCKEAGVEPKASSETNGPDAVITYALKGTEDFTNQKPETAGFYTVKAVFPANQNYNELTLTADFKITHQFNAGLEQREDGEYILCACGTGLLLETKKLNEVPEGLKQNPDVDTVEKIEQVLVEKVATGDHYVIYDVELEALIDGEWVIVTPENLPEDGVAITIPYPEGTSARYSFTVVHMFTTTGDGHVPGDTEILKVTNEPDGIHFTVKSLSPIAIGWKAGNLTVTVTNTGESADPAQQWQFRVELDDETISGEYGDMRFTDGVAEFTLISGQSLTARDLPEGVAYTVTELNGDQNGFTTTYTDDWGIITSEQDTVAAFINDKPAPVRPDDPSDDPDDPTDTPSDNEPGDTPKTGDESHLTLWFSLMILSLIGITVIVVTSIIGREKLVSANGRHIRK